jgi:Family of unknown function (DUF6624)
MRMWMNRRAPVRLACALAAVPACTRADPIATSGHSTSIQVDSIRAELVRRGVLDQHYRALDYRSLPESAGQRLMLEGMATDSANTVWLKALVTRVGWPDSVRFGADGARAAFLIVQHADADPAFQAAMLPLLAAAAQRGEIARTELAYLVDRVRVKQGSPQVYGTQYAVQEAADGSALADAYGRLRYLLPIVEDVQHLDARRRAAGLEPWRDYEREMAKVQGRNPASAPRAPQVPSFAGTYATDVSLTRDDCGDATVESRPTTVAHAAGQTALGITHAGLTYEGNVASDSAFHTEPLRVAGGGGVSYTITIAGRFTPGGLDATVTVDEHRAAPPRDCRYTVRWVGTRRP